MKTHQLLSVLVISLLHQVACDEFELPIVHFSDFHARFEPSYEGIGGLARVVTSTRQLLKDRPNGILLNAGDFFQGTLWYNLHKWKAISHFMNLLPHDVVTIGNHDFDDGIAGIVPFLKESKAPVVVTNIDATEEPTIQGLYQNSTVLIRDNQLIGVIGVILQATDILSKTEKLKFLDEVETVNAEAKRLKAKGVNIIIVLSHCGIEVDRKLAANCPDVDVIVGGHSHSFLYTGKPPHTDEPIDTYPIVVKQETDRTVLIVHSLAYTKYMGNLTVWFNDQGEVNHWQGNPILLDQSVEEDSKMLEELKPWKDAVHAVSDKVIGETKSFLNKSCRFGECTMANLVTDSMVHTYIGKAENPKYWTEVAIACANSGSIRADIPTGPITYGDAIMVNPFHGSWDVVELKGEDLLQAIEESVLRIEERDVFSMHWSGIRVTYNLTKSTYPRVQDLSVRCQECEKPVYEELKKDYWYRVVISDFIIKGGGGYTVITDKHRNHKVGNVDIDEFVKYVKSITPLDYKLDNRITIIRD